MAQEDCGGSSTATSANGERTAFVGPSRCGKTSALRIVAGLEEICEGELLIDLTRRQRPRGPPSRRLRRSFKTTRLNPHMSVEKQHRAPVPQPRAAAKTGSSRAGACRFHARPHRASRAARREHTPAAMDSASRRGVPLVRRPRAFLMDDSSSSLDAKPRTRTRVEITRRQDQLGNDDRQRHR